MGKEFDIDNLSFEIEPEVLFIHLKNPDSGKNSFVDVKKEPDKYYRYLNKLTNRDIHLKSDD